MKQNEAGFRILYEKSLDAIQVFLLSFQEIVASNSRTKDLLSSIKVQDAVFLSEDFVNKDGVVCVRENIGKIIS